jgi:preprotein translocase subunit SecE
MSDTTSLNRQTRRFAQKQGLIDGEGEPVRQRREPRAPREARTPPAQFFREVRKELKLVSWPSRDEVINYSLVVFSLLLLFTAMVAVIDYGLGEAVVKLFER